MHGYRDRSGVDVGASSPPGIDGGAMRSVSASANGVGENIIQAERFDSVCRELSARGSEMKKKAAKRSAASLYFVRTEGFEPPVSAFGGPRVIQLRYVRALRRYFGSSGERGAVVGRCLNRSSLCSTSPR